MKKRIVFLLAILTMLVLLTVGFTLGASAETYDVSDASTFKTRVEGAEDNDVINITGDFTASEALTITKNITITSDSVYTVTVNVTRLLNVKSGSTLTIDGKVVFSASGSYENIVNMCNGTAYIKGDSQIIASKTPILLMQDGSCMVANSAIYVQENALVEATSTTEDVNICYMTANGSVRGSLYIEGGTVRHTSGHGIKIASGNVTISGGTLEAKYPIYAFYGNATAQKNITIEGGTVTGTHSGIFFDGNTKRVTLTISGGTVSGGTHAIWYKASQNTSGTESNTITVSGGTLTAPSQTVFFNTCTAVTMTVTGGTIEATTAGNTIYGAEMKGDLTLNVSGTAQITAATVDAIVVAGTNGTYPGKLAATISGGTISAGTEHAINVQTGSVTMTGGTVSAPAVTIYANKAGASITISGGTVTANSNTITFQTATSQTLNISDSAQVTATVEHAIYFAADAGGTVNISGGTLSAPSATNFFYHCNAVTVNVTGGTVEATTGSNTFYGADMKGSLTLNVSGTAQITAATESAMVVTSGNTSSYPGKLVATIEGGRVTAPSWTINVKHGSVTVKGGEIRSTTGSAIYANKANGSITVTGGLIVSEGSSVFEIKESVANVTLKISGGEIVLGGSNADAIIIDNVDNAPAAITVSAGLLINANSANQTMIDTFESGTVTVSGGKFLYGANIQTLYGETAAPKTAQVSYDWNGDQVFDIFYTYFSISATSNRYSGAMEKGAAVRIAGDKTALKFTAVYSADIVRNLNNKAESGSTTTYGMLILPTEQLASLNAFDAESLAGLLTSQGLVHLVGGQNAHLKTDADGNVILQGAIFDLPDVTVSYSAISYVCLASRYETNYYFTAYNPADNARSAEDVAQAALDDADGGYTAEQITVLQSYIPQQQPQQVNAFKKEDDLVFVAPCKEF